MKKVLLLAVVALFVMMPLASFSMTTISDSDLNAITAQEGVSIYLNNITLSGINATMSWGQSNISSINRFTRLLVSHLIRAVLSAPLFPPPVTITVNGLLTIDVGVNNTTTAVKHWYPRRYRTWLNQYGHWHRRRSDDR